MSKLAAATVNSPAAPARPRLHALDALRAFVMLVGIIFHAIEAAQDARGSGGRLASLDIFLFISRAWRMPLFFFLSGFFLELLITRDGVSHTFRGRLKRIGLPFFLALLFILPIDAFFKMAYMDLGQGARFDPFSMDFLNSFLEHRFRKPRLHHLWFLYYLLGFSALWAGWRALSAKQWARSEFRIGVLGMAALFLACLNAKLAPGYQGRTDSLVWQPVEFFYYFAFFGLGALAYGHYGRASRYPIPSWLISGFIAALAGIALCYRSDLSLPLLTLAQGIFVLAGAAAVLDFFLRHLNRQSPMVAFFVASSYFTYLIHEPLLAGFGVVLGTYRWPIAAEVLTLSALTYGVCFSLYRFLVRGTALDRLLNGGAKKKIA